MILFIIRKHTMIFIEITNSERSRTDPVNTNLHFINKIEDVQCNAALAIIANWV